MPTVLTVLCAAGIVAGATGASGAPVPVPVAAQSGHWVVNDVASAALHVHGGTAQVDARVDLPPDGARDGSAVVAGGSAGFVVGRDRVWTFDRSTLTVVAEAAAAVAEVPVPIEVVGGPYLVYRRAGTVVRLGDPPVVVDAGGPLGPPVRTPDGTLAVHRPDTGAVCALRRDEVALDCDLHTRAAAPGGLATVGDTVVFVDTGSDVAHRVLFGAGLDGGTPLGTDLPADALLGDQAAGDRLPVVVPGANVLRLVDVGGLAALRPGAAPIDVPLGEGTFSAPVVGESAIALLELTSGRLLTFSPDGARTGEVRLPPGSTADALTRGDDGRVYLDEPGGGRVHVVQPGGAVDTVEVGNGRGPAVVAAPPPEQLAPVRPPPPGQLFVPSPDVRALPGGVPVGGPVLVDGPGAGLPPLLPGGVPVPGGAALPGAQPQPGAPPLPGAPPAPGAPPPALPGAVPAAPTGVVAQATGPTEAVITWVPVDGGGLPVRYTVSRSNGGGAVVSDQPRAVWTGLTTGTGYGFTVVAETAAGRSPSSEQSKGVVPGSTGAPPLAPIELNARRYIFNGAPYLVLTWKEQPAGPELIANFQVTIQGTLYSGTDIDSDHDYGDEYNYCSPAVRYEVRSVSWTGALSAPVAVDAGATDIDCTAETAIVSAEATPDGFVNLAVRCFTQIGRPIKDTDLWLVLDGEIVDQQPCEIPASGTESVQTFIRFGLERGSTHTFESRTSSPTGRHDSAPVTVTIP